MTEVVIRSGEYRRQNVSGMRFTLVRDFQTDSKGGNVVVSKNGAFPGMPEDIRIRVGSIDDIEFTGDYAVSKDDRVLEFKRPDETDEEVMDRIEQRFSILPT